VCQPKFAIVKLQNYFPCSTSSTIQSQAVLSSDMSETEKIDHEMMEHNGVNIAGNGAPLSRQVTVALSSEQYERLFFQPSAPRRGDLAKRFGKFCVTLDYNRTTS
jgi:hypothetical protein